MGVSKEKIKIYKSDSYCELFIKNFSEDCYEEGLSGAVAEVGVFRGDIAKIMNEYFFDRTLFLFDTFEGFPPSDVVIERQFQFSAAKEKDFDNTSECIVMKKMKHKEVTVLRKRRVSQNS